MTNNSDCWCTPNELFAQLHQRFHFGIDLCATKENSKCILFCRDYLKNEVSSIYDEMNYSSFKVYIKQNLLYKNTCFMNPPYSNPKPFIKKAWDDSRYGVIVCLIKCDTSTKTWGIFYDYEQQKPKPGCKIEYFSKRIKFIHPTKSSSSGPSFPSALIIMDRRNV